MPVQKHHGQHGCERSHGDATWTMLTTWFVCIVFVMMETTLCCGTMMGREGQEKTFRNLTDGMTGSRPIISSPSQNSQLSYQEKSNSGTMYGMLFESIQYFIQHIYGEARWIQVLEAANLRNMVFSTHSVYKDEFIARIAQSCADVLQDRTREEFLCFFGNCFVNFCSHYGYDRILRVAGRHYRDFLIGIDNLHETMRFSYPKLQSPSFYVEGEDCNGCILNYRSKRIGFTQYVVGQLKQCAIKFYKIPVEIIVLEEKLTAQGCHVTYRLNFNNKGYSSPLMPEASAGIIDYAYLPGNAFFKVFPFALVFNKSMEILDFGHNLKTLFPYKLTGSLITDTFALRRPVMEFTWDNIMCLQSVIFELESLTVVKRAKSFENNLTHRTNGMHFDKSQLESDDDIDEAIQKVLLRGQMKYIHDWAAVAFLCTPLLGSIEDMERIGLYINDLSMHDRTRDMVLAGWQHASQLEYSIEKQIEKSDQITDNMRKLDIWRQKSDVLLYSMIPKAIAVRLKNGADPISTCETFDQVTIMFSYLIGFTDICEKSSAMEVLESINKVFTIFDTTVDRYDVFKVETLGDAVYMVAGGVPEHTANHAQNVAALALELIDEVKALRDPTTNESLTVRIGMHTGSIVAGVVGKRMPQYCLFGDTVNTASRMQTYSQPGRIHVSEPCHECLLGTDFVTIFRGYVNVKGKGELKTYWLAGRHKEERTEMFIEQLKAERCRQLLKKNKSLQPYDNGFDFHGMHWSTSAVGLCNICERVDSNDEDSVNSANSTANSSGRASPDNVRVDVHQDSPTSSNSPPSTPIMFVVTPEGGDDQATCSGDGR